MKEIPFYKMVASGNDFVVVDNRKKAIADPVSFTRAVCARHTGIGGDGVLLMEPPRPSPLRGEGKGEGLDYRLKILNADGSEAEACGNGFRCAALVAHQRFGFAPRQRFESLAGVIDADVNGKRVRVRLMEPQDFKGPEQLQLKTPSPPPSPPSRGRGKGEGETRRKLRYYFIRVGVPHVVIFVEGLSKLPVLEIGRAVRFHEKFQPSGTNVNFVEVTGADAIGVRTYERGVEAETLACGTGSTASGIVSAQAGYVKPPVRVKTRGGEVLSVDFTQKGNHVREVYLEGEAKLVYEGKIFV